MATAVGAELPGGVRFERREVALDGKAVRVAGVFFRAADVRLAVIDNPEERPMNEMLRAAGAIAGVNGGYFHPDWRPAGLEIAGGQRVNAFERAKLLSGVFVVTKGRPRLVRSGQYTPSSADTEALQAGPFLVEGGRAVTGLNAGKSARRTVVATDGKGRWALLTVSSVTLAEAAALLADAANWPGFAITQALNLDGGSSTALWVATEPEPFYAREFGAVRNFLAVRPR